MNCYSIKSRWKKMRLQTSPESCSLLNY